MLINVNNRRRALFYDLIIRAAGIMLLGCAAFSIMTLARLTGIKPVHETTSLEILFAACGFLAASAGMMGLATGRGCFELVSAPARRQSGNDSVDFGQARPGSQDMATLQRT